MSEEIPPRYWAFVCNPKLWAIDRFLTERIEHDTWGIRRHDSRHFAPGQLAVIRVGVDTRSKAQRQGRPPLEPGIYALCEVESLAFPGTGASDAFWAPGKARPEGWPTVKIRYLRVYVKQPLTIASLRREKSELSNLMLHGFQGSSFPLTEYDFQLILRMLGEDRQALPGLSIAPPVDLKQLADMEQRYLHAAPEVKDRFSKAIERGPVGALVKRHNAFRCQICEALGHHPFSFTKPDGEPYVEAHHVSSVAEQQIGTLAAGNIITVCANHHRELHFGGVNVEILSRSFKFTLSNGIVDIPRLLTHLSK